MKIKRIAVAALSAAVFLSAQGNSVADELVVPPAEAPAEEAGAGAGAAGGAQEPKEPFVYTIVPHDTLWDISNRFLKNPFKWPRIWKLNPYIKNPDLIYPGNVVKILPDGTVEIISAKEAGIEKLPVVTLEPQKEKVVVLEPEAGAKPAAPAPSVPTISSHSMERTGFLTKKEIEASGAVVQPKNKNLYASKGDAVYISVKDPEAVKAGDRFTVFKVGPVVKHPVTRERFGNLIEILGYATVTRAGSGKGSVLEAMLDASYKEIEAGARLKPYAEPVREVEITKPDAEVSGFIVASLEGKENLSSGDIAYIDRGMKSGLKKGNVMRIFRQDKKVPDPMNRGRRVQLPPVELGTLVVVEPGETTSSCVVVTSPNSIVKGDEVKTLSQAN